MMGIGEVIQEKSLALVILAAVVWSLWKYRNDWVFNNVLIKSPKSIAYKVSFKQKLLTKLLDF